MFHRWALAASLALAACGGDDDPGPTAFAACGGDLVSGWDFAEVTFVDGAAPCTVAAGSGVDGFIVFNDTGRYSLNVKVKAWKSALDGSCDFSIAHGGFFRTVSTRVCLEGSGVTGDAIACDSNSATPARGLGQYCVAGDELTIDTSNMFDLQSTARLRCTKRP